MKGEIMYRCNCGNEEEYIREVAGSFWIRDGDEEPEISYGEWHEHIKGKEVTVQDLDPKDIVERFAVIWIQCQKCGKEGSESDFEFVGGKPDF